MSVIFLTLCAGAVECLSVCANSNETSRGAFVEEQKKGIKLLGCDWSVRVVLLLPPRWVPPTRVRLLCIFFADCLLTAYCFVRLCSGIGFLVESWLLVCFLPRRCRSLRGERVAHIADCAWRRKLKTFVFAPRFICDVSCANACWTQTFGCYWLLKAIFHELFLFSSRLLPSLRCGDSKACG